MAGGPYLSKWGEATCVVFALVVTFGGYFLGRALGWWT